MKPILLSPAKNLARYEGCWSEPLGLDIWESNSFKLLAGPGSPGRLLSSDPQLSDKGRG